MSVVLVVLVGACGSDTQPFPPDGGAGPDVVDPDGGALFRETCGRCHGADAAGTPDAPQILSPVRAYATYVVRAGRGIEMGFPTGMEGIPSGDLSDAHLGTILDFLSAAPKPATGPGLYLRYCGNCHGADAWGGRVGKSLTEEEGEEDEEDALVAPDDDEDELLEAVREGHGGQQFQDRTEYMPAWSATEITDTDIAMIRAYLATLPRSPYGGGDD